MRFKVTNTGRARRTYHADAGNRVSFAPGETKTVGTRPPETNGWEIDRIDETEEQDVEEAEEGDSA